ncbi:MAG: flotillin family protein [Actinomycetota bacterium]
MPFVITIGLFVLIAALVVLAIALAVTRLYRKVPQGRALVVSTMRAVQVSFVGRVVLPIVHKAEIMDMTVKTMTVERRGASGLVCGDNIRADIRVYFYIRVNKAEQDVIKVAQAIGCERASDPDQLAELFDAKFNEALKTVGKQMDFEQLYNERSLFRDKVVEEIGSDLNGYVLEDVAIDEIEQTPVSQLDPDNILDAQGIRKITEMNEDQHVATTVAAEDERKRITEKKVETDKAVLDLERERADAQARQKREIAVVAATEAAETARVEAEQRQRAELARLDTEQEVAVREENKLREVEIATEVRRQAAQVEAERANAEIAKAVATREAETVEAEKVVESTRLEIAGIREDRVNKEYGVAAQEERTDTLRVVEAADRAKQATVLAASAAAEEQFLTEVKAAEARQQAAEHDATAVKITATANKEASIDQAEADKKTAEGDRAKASATGLAEADVISAKAEAAKTEGLAEIAVDAAKVEVISATGEAEATAIRARGEAEGAALEATKLAEAAGVGAALREEASGLSEKADAMAKLEAAGQEHAEFLERLRAQVEIETTRITTEAEVGKAEATARAEAYRNATFDIVGGSDAFVDAITAGTTTAKRVDRTVGESTTLSSLLDPYLNGDGDLIAELTGMVEGLGSNGARDAAIASIAGRIAMSDDPARTAAELLGRVLPTGSTPNDHDVIAANEAG